MSVENLEKLAQLYERGLLTRDEFEKQKQSLLNASDAQGQSAPSVADRTSADQPYATADERDSLKTKTKQKRSRIVKAFWGLLIFCALAMLASYLVMAPPGVDPPISSLLTKALPMPKPVVVYQTASESPKSGIWDYVMRVSGEVQNTGAAGAVVIKTIMYQNGESYERVEKRYMNSDERVEIVQDFPEAEAAFRHQYQILATPDNETQHR